MKTQRLGLVRTLLATSAILFSGCGSAKMVQTQSGQIKTPEQIAQDYNLGMEKLLSQAENDSKKYSIAVENGINKYQERTQGIKNDVRKTAKECKETLHNCQRQIDEFLKRQDPNYSPQPGNNTTESK